MATNVTHVSLTGAPAVRHSVKGMAPVGLKLFPCVQVLVTFVS